MNKDRRRRLQDALNLVEQAEALLSQAQEIATDVREEEQDAFDNMPESLQSSERGDQMQAAIDALEGVTFEGILDESRDYIQTAIDA